MLLRKSVVGKSLLLNSIPLMKMSQFIYRLNTDRYLSGFSLAEGRCPKCSCERRCCEPSAARAPLRGVAGWEGTVRSAGEIRPRGFSERKLTLTHTPLDEHQEFHFCYIHPILSIIRLFSISHYVQLYFIVVLKYCILINNELCFLL